MGLLDMLFGGKKDYPPLPDNDPAQGQLAGLKEPLGKLVGRVSDDLEVVPGDSEAYVFLGKPPKRFGIAWIHDGKVSGLKELAEERKLSQVAVAKLINRIGEAYGRAANTSRYTVRIGAKQAVVTPSVELGNEVRQILASA